MAAKPCTTPGIVLANGRILTMDPTGSVVEAVWIRGERIAAVGASAEVLGSAGARAEVIDLQGATVLPGLIDTHAHFSRIGAQTAAQASLYGSRSVQDIVERLEAHRDRLPDGVPVQGRGDCFHERHFVERRQVCSADLDRVAADRPVAISDVNKTIVNTYVLEHHLDADRLPPGVRLPTDERTGRPTGVFALSAQAAVRPPPFAPDISLEEAISSSSAEFARFGVTTVADAHPPIEAIREYLKLAQTDRLGTRVVVMPATALVADEALRTEFAGLARAEGPVCLGPAKQFYDRFVMRRSAYMSEPYRGEPDNYGSTFVSLAELRSRVANTWGFGWPLGIHVTGDRGLAEAARVLAEVCHPPVHGPSHVIHAYFPKSESLGTLARHGIGVAAQPAFLRAWGETLREFAGEQRAAAFLPLRRYRSAGVRVGGGSDAPVVHWNPFRGMATAMDRRTLGGDVLGEAEELTFEEVLRLYTVDAAAVLGMDDQIGSIEVGKMADLVVLDRDPRGCCARDLAEAGAEITVVAGRAIYGDPAGIGPGGASVSGSTSSPTPAEG